MMITVNEMKGTDFCLFWGDPLNGLPKLYITSSHSSLQPSGIENCVTSLLLFLYPKTVQRWDLVDIFVFMSDRVRLLAINSDD